MKHDKDVSNRLIALLDLSKSAGMWGSRLCYRVHT